MDLTPEQRDRLIMLDRAHGIQELLRGLAHDIRNNLQVVALASQLGEASRTPEIDLRVEQAIEEMNRTLELLGSMGRHTHDIARTVALEELVRLATRTAGYQRNLPGAVVRFGPAPRATLAISPAVGLQILGNVIANAKEAAPGQPIEVAFVEAPGLVEVTVEDRGPGLGPDAGAPLASSRSEETHGGTGLFAARALADRHGGSLDWSARESGGTRVRIRLPVA